MNKYTFSTKKFRLTKAERSKGSKCYIVDEYITGQEHVIVYETEAGGSGIAKFDLSSAGTELCNKFKALMDERK